MISPSFHTSKVKLDVPQEMHASVGGATGDYFDYYSHGPTLQMKAGNLIGSRNGATSAKLLRS